MPAMLDSLMGDERQRKGEPQRLPPKFQPARVDQALKLLPQPQPPVAFGLSNVKPEPCIDET